ncbi:MAG: M16 family metallopeptidase [Anaerolineales bacterium]
MSGAVTRTRLRNGLEVRLKEIHTAPLISTWVWYRVGARNEVPGITGISHWVEHMQFKGTPTFPSGTLDRAISREGGFWNAFTWMDWTAYFETMPQDRVELALEVEADRMRNSLYEPAEVESERTVIISEREGSENEPTFRLSEEVHAAAFRVHPYHHMTIGDMADLRTITRDNLYDHYRRHYVPGNAVLAIAGNFKTSTMLRRVRKLFGSIPSGLRPEYSDRPEPEQPGEKRITVEGPGQTAYLELAYQGPEATHEDFIPMAVLDSALTGASNLNLFGGGISNKTSRLYKKLVEGELAASVVGGLAATIHPYLYSIMATVRPDSSPEKVLVACDEEIQKMLDKPVTKEEVARAIKQAKALFAYASESITNQAFWLGYSEMFATYDWFEKYLDRLSKVTPEQVLEVANRRLVPSRRVVGVYSPNGTVTSA